MKALRSRPSPGLSFNHSTLVQIIRCEDSLKFWGEMKADKYNPHLHKRAEFKIRWLKRKLELLERLV